MRNLGLVVMASCVAAGCSGPRPAEEPSPPATDSDGGAPSAPEPDAPVVQADARAATPDVAPDRSAPDMAPPDRISDARASADATLQLDGKLARGTPDPVRPDLVCKGGEADQYTCIDYCNCMSKWCTGKYARFTSYDQCLTYCHGLGKTYAVDPKDPTGRGTFCWLATWCASMEVHPYDHPDLFCGLACPAGPADYGKKGVPAQCPPPP